MEDALWKATFESSPYWTKVQMRNLLQVGRVRTVDPGTTLTRCG